MCESGVDACYRLLPLPLSRSQVHRKRWDVRHHRKGDILRLFVDEARDRFLSVGADASMKCSHVLSGGLRWSHDIGPWFSVDRFRGLVIAPDARRTRTTLYCVDIEVRAYLSLGVLGVVGCCWVLLVLCVVGVVGCCWCCWVLLGVVG